MQKIYQKLFDYYKENKIGLHTSRKLKEDR